MIDVDLIKTRISTQTGYTVELARIKEPDLHDLIDLPVIYINYASLDSSNPTTPIAKDIYNLHGEDLVQSFDIHIVCLVENLPTIWKNVYRSLIGFNPVSLEANHTSFTYSQGGMMGISNGRYWWLDRWRIGFPTLDVST